MAVIATVATRPWARWLAVIPPAISICARTQPPKMSPLGFASAGMAKVRMASSPLGDACAVPEGTADSALGTLFFDRTMEGSWKVNYML